MTDMWHKDERNFRAYLERKYFNIYWVKNIANQSSKLRHILFSVYYQQILLFLE
jgi:hypothetical protein